MNYSVDKYRAVISEMPDAALDQYIVQHNRYEVAALQVAFEQLEKRGRPVDPTLRQQIITAAEKRDSEKEASLQLRKIFTDDPDAPVLYAEYQVFVFSLLGTPVTGALMLAEDLRSLNRDIASAVALFVGACTLFLSFAILVPQSHILEHFQFISNGYHNWIIVNVGGAVLLSRIMWSSFFVPIEQDEMDFVHRRKATSRPKIYSLAALALHGTFFLIGKCA